MPKKTKKEKLLASYHKKLRLLENKQTNTPDIQSKVISEISTQPIFENETKTVISKPVSQELLQNNNYFFTDLRKSLLLIILIMGVEVGLYFSKLIK